LKPVTTKHGAVIIQGYFVWWAYSILMSAVSVNPSYLVTIVADNAHFFFTQAFLYKMCPFSVILKIEVELT
jgi:hypothetical protein